MTKWYLAGCRGPDIGAANRTIVLLLAPLSDTVLTEGVAAVDADRFNKQLGADRTLQLRLRQLPVRKKKKLF
jgi:hypothetical protein